MPKAISLRRPTDGFSNRLSEAVRHERRCLITADSLPTERMVRFIIGPDGRVVPDIAAKLPGRGYWITAQRDTIEKAVARHAFVRAWQRRMKEAGVKSGKKTGGDGYAEALEGRGSITVDPDLADQVERLLASSCLRLLGLARRAGQLVAGFDAVHEALRLGQATVLVRASDASPDGSEKLARIGRGIPEIIFFSRDELSLALGRENVVHAALKVGGLSKRLLTETERLAGLRQRDLAESLVKA